jgi:hypothetical protein
MLFTLLYVKVDSLLTYGKCLHDCIISIRREIWAHEVLVPCQECEQSCICVLEVMYLCVRGIEFASFYDFETVPIIQKKFLRTYCSI